MTIEELEDLIAKLKPTADEDTINAVIREIVSSLHRPRIGIYELKALEGGEEKLKKKKPTAHSLFNEWNPNDPRNW